MLGRHNLNLNILLFGIYLCKELFFNFVIGENYVLNHLSVNDEWVLDFDRGGRRQS